MGWGVKKMVKITSEIAEICGIHAGDGYLRNDGHRIELDISGNVEEKDYYDLHVIPLFNKTFNLGLKGRFFPSRNTYGFVVRDKKVVEFLHSLGFPYGNKSTIVRIPEKILKSKNSKIFSSFLRGIFDTDGNINFLNRKSAGKYISFKKTHNYYPRIVLTSVSSHLMSDILFMLTYFGFSSNTFVYKHKEKNWNDTHKIFICGEDNIKLWMRIIGSKNFNKHSRYLIWKKFGFCPPNLTFNQRKDILVGNLNPNEIKGP